MEHETNSTTTQEVFLLEIDMDNEGIVFYASPSTTVHELMTFICEAWLNKLRNGDGGVDDHLWTVSRPVTLAYPIPENYEDDDAYMDALDAFEQAQAEERDGIPTDTLLENIPGFENEDEILKVMYDMGGTTYFDICFKGIEDIPHDTPVPSLVPPLVEDSLVPYSPPTDSPNLNDIYPHAHQMMFAAGATAKWICPFPTSISCAGFVEGGFRSTADICFLPQDFSTIHEVLVAMDVAMKKYPDQEYTRILFPISMTEEAEARFLQHEKDVNEYLEFRESFSYAAYFGPNGNDISQLSANIQSRMWKPATQVNIRVTETDLASYDDSIHQSFPMCGKAIQNGLWASYRRGKVIVSEKKVTRESPEERGIPLTVLAEKVVQVDSLHQFFCICESLFLQVDASRRYESLLNDPTVLSSSSKEALASLT